MNLREGGSVFRGGEGTWGKYVNFIDDEMESATEGRYLTFSEFTNIPIPVLEAPSIPKISTEFPVVISRHAGST
jgi:hypothetical protein